jgi:hypothetical protein
MATAEATVIVAAMDIVAVTVGTTRALAVATMEVMVVEPTSAVDLGAASMVVAVASTVAGVSMAEVTDKFVQIEPVGKQSGGPRRLSRAEIGAFFCAGTGDRERTSEPSSNLRPASQIIDGGV